MKRPILRSGVVAATALAVVAGGVALTSHHAGNRTVRVTMADAGPLEAGDEVRTAGVLVGQVKSVALDQGRAQVTLSVDPDVLPLHDDATVTMRPINILGEDYIDLDRGSDSHPFTSSTTIPQDRTKVAGTLQDLLSTFQAPTAAALANVVTTAGEGLDGNGGNLAKTIEQLSSSMQLAQQLGTLLSQQNGTLAAVVENADPIAAAIADDNGKTLDSLLGSTTQVLDAVSSQQQALRSTIDQLPATLLSARRTLNSFAGVAQQATPTLRSLRPLTGNLSQVVDELEGFTQSANPALTSLPGVLDQANLLLDQAAPVVASLNQTGPHLARVARGLRPVSDQLLEKHIDGLMGFVRKWALSTNGYDGLAHYFRGVVYVTPTALKSLLTSLFPSGINLPGTSTSAVGTKGGTGLAGGLGSTVTGVTNGVTGTVKGVTGGVGGLLGSLLGGTKRTTAQRPAAGTAASSRTGAFGLTEKQEKSMLTQLLGGAQS